MTLLLSLALCLLQEDPQWSSYHGGFSLDGVANTTVPDNPVRLWRFKAGKQVEFTPVVGDGQIYFTTIQGDMFALDMAGKQVWKTKLKDDLFSSPPIYTNKLVIAGSMNGFLHAIHAADGRTKWRYDVEDNIMGSANRVDLKGNRKAVVIPAQAVGSIHCVDLETGRRIWKTEEVDRADGSASVGGGRIVMGSCASALHVFSVAEARKVRDIPLGAECQVAGGVALSGGLAFAGTRNGSVCAVDVETGKIVWTNRDSKREAFTTPAVDDRTVVFGSDDKHVYGLERKTGKKIWSFDADDIPSSPVIAGDRVVVSAGGSLYLLRLKDGRKVWSADVSDYLTSPAVVGGMIIVGADDGTITLFGKSR